MTELLKVYLLPTQFRTCFFYRNSLKNHVTNNGEVWGVEIKFGKNYESTIFGSISLQIVGEIPDNCIGIPNSFANKIGIKQDDSILLKNCLPFTIESLEITPISEENYNLLVSNYMFFKDCE